jgi:tripartite-type tricarboxylate transporter receptor subunit TctC
LAVSSLGRTPLLPDIPTMIESGVPDYVVLTYSGMVAPVATPPAVIDKLNAAINESLRSPEVTAAFARIGAEPGSGSPQDFATFLASETVKWVDVVKRSGLRID